MQCSVLLVLFGVLKNVNFEFVGVERTFVYCLVSHRYYQACIFFVWVPRRLNICLVCTVSLLAIFTLCDLDAAFVSMLHSTAE